MTKAKDDVITRGNYLDRSIIRITLARAEGLYKTGHSMDTAVMLAAPGAWSEYRAQVLAALRGQLPINASQEPGKF